MRKFFALSVSALVLLGVTACSSPNEESAPERPVVPSATPEQVPPEPVQPDCTRVPVDPATGSIDGSINWSVVVPRQGGVAPQLCAPWLKVTLYASSGEIDSILAQEGVVATIDDVDALPSYALSSSAVAGLITEQQQAAYAVKAAEQGLVDESGQPFVIYVLREQPAPPTPRGNPRNDDYSNGGAVTDGS